MKKLIKLNEKITSNLKLRIKELKYENIKIHSKNEKLLMEFQKLSKKPKLENENKNINLLEIEYKLKTNKYTKQNS